MRNLQGHAQAGRDGIDGTWMFLERSLPEIIARIPPFSMNWMLKGGAVTRQRLRALTRSGKTFDAALFNHLVPCMFLGEFRRSVPTLLSVDSTPRTLEQFNRWYLNRTRGRSRLVQSFKDRLTARVYNETARLIAWSSLVRDSLIEDYGVAPSRIEVIPPGVDLGRWIPPDRSRKIDDTTTVLFVGGEFLRKGGDLLLDVSRRPEFRRCRFHFVTKDFHGVAGDNVEVHSALSANSKELVGLYARADIFVMPTRADLAPTNVLCEAMAMELPVITTGVGGLDKVVRDGINGYVIDVDDAGMLAEKLLALVGLPPLRRSMGRAGRAIVEEEFNLSRNAHAIFGHLHAAASRIHADTT